MNDNQELPHAGHANDQEALFGSGVVRVRNRDGKRVAKHSTRFIKSDGVLSAVSRLLLAIPLKRESLHLTSSLSESPAGCATRNTWTVRHHPAHWPKVNARN
jgi:hypothetical protein